MFYYLSRFSTDPDWGFLRLFDYVSFRAGGAGVLAFLLVVLLGLLQVQQLN